MREEDPTVEQASCTLWMRPLRWIPTSSSIPLRTCAILKQNCSTLASSSIYRLGSGIVRQGTHLEQRPPVARLGNTLVDSAA